MLKENTVVWEDDNKNEAENEKMDVEDRKSTSPKKESTDEEKKNTLRKMLPRKKRSWE